TKALVNGPSATPRRAAAGVALASLIAGGFVTATTAAVSASADPRATTAVIDASARDRAAARADRAARPAVAVPAKVPAPAKVPVKAPAKAAAPVKKAKKAKPPAWNSPMPGVPLSSCYGPRWGTMHQGLDFAGKPGTKIRAVGAGTVFAAGYTYAGY